MFDAIWENFEGFDIVSYPVEDSTTFLTTSKARRFSRANFVKAYEGGEMDIEDLVYILF